MNLNDTSSVISSPVSVDGAEPCVSPDGLTLDLFGQVLAPVNRSALEQLTKHKEQAITAIFGRAFPNSLASANLQSSLENRLETQFLGLGGTEPRWILKRKLTPLRQQYSEVMQSARYTSARGSTGWPTPVARDGKDVSRFNAFLSQRQRHSPSMATKLLEAGVPWQAIGPIYCLAMGYPSKWFASLLKALGTQSSRKSPLSSSKPA